MNFLLTGANFWNAVVTHAAKPAAAAAPTHIEKSVAVSQPTFVSTKNREFWVERAGGTPSEVVAPVSVLPPVVTRAAVPTVAPERVVVIAPHPDDEILCCSRTLADRIAEGAAVSIIFVTDGDARTKDDWNESRVYGAQRRTESIAAARKLGIPQKNLFFLGFPDGELAEMLRRGQVRSEYTGRRATARSTTYPGTRYTSGDLRRVLTKKLAELNPDEIFAPGLNDTHPDHLAVAQVVQAVAPATAVEQAYTVHGIRGGASVETDLEKLKLIRLFRTQRHDGSHIKFLEQFASIRERFEQVVVAH